MDPEHLLAYVIRPTLAHMGDRYANPAAAQLVLGTAIVESRLKWLQQLGGGPARGLWQMEPETFKRHMNWLRAGRHLLRSRINELLGGDELLGEGMGEFVQLAGNLYFACAMCRVHYLRVLAPLPEYDDIRGMGRYWKAHYNTPAGKGTVEGYIKAWNDAHS